MPQFHYLRDMGSDASAAAVLIRARSVLRNETSDPDVRVLTREDGAPPVAFLVTLNPVADLILPLRRGRNFVGRGSDRSRPYRPTAEGTFLEQCQWFVDCQVDQATVWDAASTNLSVLLPKIVVSTLDLSTGMQGFLDLFKTPGAIPLPHANVRGADHQHAIHEGDVLRGVYASFAFGWI